VTVPEAHEVQGKHFLRPLGLFMKVPVSQLLHFVPDCTVQSLLTNVPVRHSTTITSVRYRSEVPLTPDNHFSNDVKADALKSGVNHSQQTGVMTAAF